MSEAVLTPTGQSVKHWRLCYSDTARSDSWLAAHQWNYGPEVAQATARDVRQKLMLEPDDRVLEIGSGSGAFLQSVLLPGQRAIGFDLCDEQIRSGERFGVDRKRINLGVAEAARIPVSSESFDKILCYSVVHYFPDDEYLRCVIAEMLRVCRPGGLVLLGDVAGVMERSRKVMIRNGFPAVLADAVLCGCLPLRHALRSLTRRGPREGRFFRRSFLRRLLGGFPCEFEFLEQHIAGRPASDCRFDLRLRKRSG